MSEHPNSFEQQQAQSAFPQTNPISTGASNGSMDAYATNNTGLSLGSNVTTDASMIETPKIHSDFSTSDPKDEEEVDNMKKRLKELEVEAQRLQSMQAELQKESQDLAAEDKKDIDARSIYVGNVDYGATPEELQAHFQSCGTINRVTIVCDKFTGHPKGFAYIEFYEPALVASALVLNESLFRGRPLKIVPKRTNLPNFMLRGRGGGGYRGRGSRGGFMPRGGYRGGFKSRGRGMGPY